MSQLTSLPTELLLSIAESLPSQKDLSALVQTTKRTHTALQLYLYKANIQNHNQSALLWAAKHGHTTLTQKMLDAGARISTLNSSHNPTNPIEGNAIALAASGPHVETLACLLSEKRPGQACDPTQLRDALREGAIPAHSLEAAKLLLQYKAPLEPANTLQSYLSALGAAVAASWADMIPFLLEAGACPGKYEIPTPLECAIRTNQPEVVEMLLGAGMRLSDDAAFTIGFAVRFGRLGVLKLLLETGVRAEQSDLDLAREQMFEEAVALLEGCDFEDLPKKENVREFVERKVRKRRVTEPRYEDLTMQVCGVVVLVICG
ncbi:hypothetical protein PEXP_086320 [Penicillium expansum]|nr:hypothetical protein PEXP_086320 [Penicillium expansum]